MKTKLAEIEERLKADNKATSEGRVNFAFIQNAPTDVAYLIARVKKLEGALEYQKMELCAANKFGEAEWIRKALESEPGE